MRKVSVQIAYINSTFMILIFFLISGNAYSFTSSEEYLSHIDDSPGCSTEKCHSDFSNKPETSLHSPVADGNCSICHTADAYPNKFGLNPDQRKTCAVCHKKTENRIVSSEFVHGPIKNGDCISCHDPHKSDQPFFLRQSYSKLCSSCHNLKRLYVGKAVHKPVKDGNCGLCHDPHASNYKSRLTDIGANLCVICHDDMVSGMAEENIHAPITKSGCTDCHDPHSGETSLRLKADTDKLCFNCHEEKRNEIDQYTTMHKPAFEGKCISCHSPHFSKFKFLLLDKVDTLCYNCHKESRIWKKKKYQHGPVVQGNCTACHNPHGSDNAYILRLSFPQKFYTNYEKGKYDLCFLCHKEALVTSEKTERVTYFRNGTKNIHNFHVNQKKGRTCRACHDVHASDLENHLREEFKYGTMMLPLSFTKTETGGSCTPSCHKERRYDRENEVFSTGQENR